MTDVPAQTVNTCQVAIACSTARSDSEQVEPRQPHPSRRKSVRRSFVFLASGVTVMGVCILATVLIVCRRQDLPVDAILANYQNGVDHRGLTIRYPLDETQFPPEIAAPTFRWEDGNSEVNAWVLAMDFQDDEGRMSFSSIEGSWTPSEVHWETIKRRCRAKPVKVTILGVNRRAGDKIISAERISISTSEDEVGAPIFYREVNLPFIVAAKDPSLIRWRFGPISSKEQPPIVLDNLPVCGNCHSFSSAGGVLGMDVDYANDKGSYIVTPVAEEMVLDKSKVITWSDYHREDGELTYGLLSQVSPSGKYVVSTVKDQSVFIPTEPLAFSQLFFPIKGILAIYDREAKEFHALPGADDGRFVQSNATWSPDEKHIVFARSKVHKLKNPHKRKTVLLEREECAEFTEGRETFLFDLYRIPFNDGKGGKAEPLLGASSNGMSNYFARYSPDGKWIVFCKAKSFMLLQPDSELYIIPAEGGEARRLRCNTNRMNSWHSWSPNGKWLVFSSKANTAYTQLFLTHVDEQGQSTPPVVLDNFTEKNRAANIPEFVNNHLAAMRTIHEEFVDDDSFLRAGLINARQGFHEEAERDFLKVLELNPEEVDALVGLGTAQVQLKKLEDANAHFTRATELQPDNQHAYNGLGNLLALQGKFQEAKGFFRIALRIDPSLSSAHFRLGVVLLDTGSLQEAIVHLAEAVRLDPDNKGAFCSLAVALYRAGKPEAAIEHFQRALQLDPDFLLALLQLASVRVASSDPALRDGEQAVVLATRACELTRYGHPEALHCLAAAYAEVGQFSSAVSTVQLAIRTARAGGNEDLAEAMRKSLELYMQHKPLRADLPH